MQIDFKGNIEDISAMFVSAERYALGRMTYIVGWTCEIISNNLNLLTEKDKKVMIRDIERCTNYGCETDKYEWRILLSKLRNNLEDK